MDEMSLYAIRDKEEALHVLADNYHRKRRELEQKKSDLNSRYRQIMDMIDMEKQQMSAMLQRYGATYNEGASFYQECNHLQQEASYIYNRETFSIEEEEETSRISFYHQQEDLEYELQALRREYVDRH